MTYSQKINILNEFTDESHKKLYYNNLFNIFGCNDLNLIKKLISFSHFSSE